MENSLKIALGIMLGALAIGLTGYPALGANMMGGGTGTGMMGASGHMGMMGGMANMMNGNIDMNAMHKAMHGDDPDFDMNQMHQRMLAGNLTQEDFKEMKEHCPMMG